MAFDRFTGGVQSRNKSPVPVERKEIAGGAGKRQVLLDGLRSRIRVIEQTPVSFTLPPAPRGTGRNRSACVTSNVVPLISPTDLPGEEKYQEARRAVGPTGKQTNQARRAVGPTGTQKSNWTFGLPEIDGALPWNGLSPGGLHEVRPETYQDSWAALGFAKALIARRMAGLGGSGRNLFLWGTTDAAGHEFGLPYGPGLQALGLDPGALLMVRTRRPQELAWALEEGVKSRALAAVLGHVSLLSTTSERRLALAGAAYETPCLLISGHQTSGVGPALTRWRIAAAPSRPHAFDARAPGPAVWHVTLERCRWGPHGLTWTVEWSNEAYDFRLAAPLADRTVTGRSAAGLPATIAG